MTADEIKKIPIPGVDQSLEDVEKKYPVGSWSEALDKAFAMTQLVFLREIAVQFAEFNERCSKNCTPQR